MMGVFKVVVKKYYLTNRNETAPFGQKKLFAFLFTWGVDFSPIIPVARRRPAGR